MKKFLSLICILTCMLGLTACGANNKTSEYQSEKIENAKIVATEGYFPILKSFMKEGIVEAYSEYTLEEIEHFCEQSGFVVDGNGFMSAAESFSLNYAKTGEITLPENPDVTVTVDDDALIVRFPVNGEKKNAEVEIIVSNDLFYKLESGALNPVSSFGELMQKAALNTLLGMCTVFAVLILISLIIASFGLIGKAQNAMKKKPEEKTGIDNAVAQITKQEEITDESDDTELVAVIAAAVAAYEGSASSDGYVVRSIRRIR